MVLNNSYITRYSDRSCGACVRGWSCWGCLFFLFRKGFFAVAPQAKKNLPDILYELIRWIPSSKFYNPLTEQDLSQKCSAWKDFGLTLTYDFDPFSFKDWI